MVPYGVQRREVQVGLLRDRLGAQEISERPVAWEMLSLLGSETGRATVITTFALFLTPIRCPHFGFLACEGPSAFSR